MPADFVDYSDEETWSDSDQLTHYQYLKNRFGYQCALAFANKTIQSLETEEEENLDEYEQDGWLQEEVSDEEIFSSDEEYVTPLRKKRKIPETSEEDEESSAASEL